MRTLLRYQGFPFRFSLSSIFQRRLRSYRKILFCCFYFTKYSWWSPLLSLGFWYLLTYLVKIWKDYCPLLSLYHRWYKVLGITALQQREMSWEVFSMTSIFAILWQIRDQRFILPCSPTGFILYPYFLVFLRWSILNRGIIIILLLLFFVFFITDLPCHIVTLQSAVHVS